MDFELIAYDKDNRRLAMWTFHDFGTVLSAISTMWRTLAPSVGRISLSHGAVWLGEIKDPTWLR